MAELTDILEVGSGQGFHAYHLNRRRGNRVVGIDVSAADIKVAQKRYPAVDFRRMDATKLAFSDASFDGVYALDVLEHVDDLVSVVCEMVRVLRPAGQLFINVPAERSERWLLQLRPTYFSEIHHVRIFRGSELEDLLATHGCRLVKRQPTGFLQHLELWYLFTRQRSSDSQLSIGNWRRGPVSIAVHLGLLYLDPVVLKTPLRWLPVWLLTLPLGAGINLVGNRFFPKSIRYEFKKVFPLPEQVQRGVS